jgi:hypothetical protein
MCAFWTIAILKDGSESGGLFGLGLTMVSSAEAPDIVPT